ncbi:cullin family protein [Ancylostoma ceylanicum]|uniref:Cullin family protein n=2 Tax=Ancylostoma TaxID=29169 RepID=A0A0D6LUA9_9BILA|nr:cullin family protein [Ancylostoma ceylanicum]
MEDGLRSLDWKMVRMKRAAMDEKYVTQVWEMLKKAIQEIQRKNNSGLSFEELYRNAYTMVLHKYGERLYTGLKQVVEDHLRNYVRVKIVESLDSGNFLEVMNEAWSDHTTAMVMIRDILMYMDRVYVEQNKVEQVFHLGLAIFRTGIKSACQMLVALGIHSHDVYVDEFETPFLVSTAEYYRCLSMCFLVSNSASLYVKKVEQCIREESERAKRYLDPQTESKVLDVLENVLIKDHMHTVVNMEHSGVHVMLSNDKFDQLASLYGLLQRVENGLNVMADAMSRYYKQHMARRLLLDKSISDDMERMMISKLKTECGCHFTLKLENMFRDKELWATQATSFKEYRENHQRGGNMIDISVRVLTAGIWPTQSVPVCILPSACEQAFNMFSNFYVSKHNGRKLTLNTMLGTADVKAVFYGGGTAAAAAAARKPGTSDAPPRECRKEENKILMVNTHQMVILMCFNSHPRLTFQALLDHTNIAERELKRNLQSLAMDATDEFSVNDNFQSKLTRIKVQLVTFKGETEPEKKETRTKVEDDRKHEIEAAIVRVMKSRKVLDHNNLITEVTQQLKHRFLPNPILIKKRIESLIERDYLARDAHDLKLYNYVA